YFDDRPGRLRAVHDERQHILAEIQWHIRTLLLERSGDGESPGTEDVVELEDGLISLPDKERGYIALREVRVGGYHVSAVNVIDDRADCRTCEVPLRHDGSTNGHPIAVVDRDRIVFDGMRGDLNRANPPGVVLIADVLLAEIEAR